MPQGNLVEVLGRELRQGSPGELMVESSSSRQRRPPYKTNKEMSDEATDAAALTYLLTWVLFTGVPASCVLLRVQCPQPLGPRSAVYELGALCCVCGVVGQLAPVHRCARSVCCVVCVVSWATWLLFTAPPARCVLLRVRCPGPLGSCSPVCSLGALCCVCGVLGHFAPVQRHARSVRCVECAAFWAIWLLFTSLVTWCVVLHVRYPGPLGLCSPVCPLGAVCCLCSVLGHLAPVQRRARSVRCVECAAFWAI